MFKDELRLKEKEGNRRKMGENEGNEYRVRGKKMGEKALPFSFLLR